MRPYNSLYKFIKIILFIVISCIFIMCSNETVEISQTSINEEITKTQDLIVVVKENEWKELNLTDSGYKNEDELEKQISEYINQIVEYTGKNDWSKQYVTRRTDGIKRIYVNVGFTDGASISSGTSIRYNKLYFEHGLAPIVHELTHMILGECASPCLSEGFAGYMQDRICNNPSLFSWGLDINIRAANYLNDNNREIIDNMGSKEVPYEYLSGEKKAIFYVCSQSFCMYLIEKYGIDKFLMLYSGEGKTDDYSQIYNKALSELILDWKNNLISCSGQMTEEEIDKYIDDVWAEHNLTE